MNVNLQRKMYVAITALRLQQTITDCKQNGRFGDDTRMFTRLKDIVKEMGILLLAANCLIVVAAGQMAAADQAKPVDVVNTPDVKVVNTPTVNVGNTPTVNLGKTADVNVTNTPTVQLSGTASVNVKNDKSAPLIIRSADEPARQPFANSGIDNVFAGSVGSPLVVPAVPQGKVLVIEYIDFKTQTAVTSGAITRYELVHKTGGNQSFHAFPVFSSPNPNGPGTIFLGREQVRFYADPGSQVFFTIIPDGRASGANDSIISVVASISGYLVDAQ